MENSSENIDVRELLSQCPGRVFIPGDEGYEGVCSPWNLAWPQRPAVAVRAASEDDVHHAVRFAAERGLGVAVQNRGHGPARQSDGETLLISTSELDSVAINAENRTATIGGGCAWSPVLEGASEHGLAPLVGSAPHVGAVGYSLGGGMGWLARKYGLGVDAIRSLRVVLADGSLVTTSPDREPELFWAMCGTAGSSLGVVVEMTVELVDVAEVYAGSLIYPIDAATEVFDRYVEWSERAPDGLTSAFTIMAFPPMDIVPEPLRGNTFAMIRGCFTDTNAAKGGEELVNEWRNWRAPLMDMWSTIPWSAQAMISQDPVDPVPAHSAGRWLSHLDRTVLDAMLDAVVGGEGPSPMLFAETRHAGGAVTRKNPNVSFEARGAERMLEMVGLVMAPDAYAEIERRFDSTWQRLEPMLAPLSGYINFAEGQERESAYLRSFTAPTLERLAAAKRRYDPQNLFRNGLPLLVEQ